MDTHRGSASPQCSLVGVVAIFAWLAYTYFIYPTFLSPLSRVPNAHFSSAFSSLWMRWQRRGGREGIVCIYSAHRRKGAIVRLALNEVSVASLEGLRVIFGGAFERPRFFEQLCNYDTLNTFTTVEVKAHGEKRRRVANVYSKSFIMNSTDMRALSESIILERLLPVLDEAVKKGRKIDMVSINRALGADFASAYIFGVQNGTNFSTRAKKYYEMQDDFLDHVLDPIKSPGRLGVEAFGLQLCEAARADLQQQSLRKSITSEKKSTVPVVFSQLREYLRKTGSEGHLPGTKIHPELASEMLDHFLAGQETSRIAMMFLEWELSKKPEVQARLRKELLSLNPPLDATQLPNFQALDALPFLDACITETLRLHAPQQTPVYRVVPPQGCTLHGRFIPGGVTISTAIYCLHRNEDVFPNASTWDPERWISVDKGPEDEERLREMKRWFWAFASGPRTCTGRHFAMLNMKITIAAIYTNYTTSIVKAKEHGTERCAHRVAGD